MTKIDIFDRSLQIKRRSKALQQAASFDFLHREVADRLSERVEEIKRSFTAPLQMGVLGGLLPCLAHTPALTTADRADCPRTQPLLIDEESLSLPEDAYDLIVSNLLLHWVNDLPGALIQINHSLKADGLFLGALFGGESLKELRSCLMQAEEEILGGVSPRISPFVDVRDAGSLLQRAGFALPVADVDTLTVSYSSPLKLMHDLRGMGESNLVKQRFKGLTPPSVLMRAAALYQEKYGDAMGQVPATFQIVYLTGWAPHESQQKPLRPGSAKASLAEALKTDESKFTG